MKQLLPESLPAPFARYAHGVFVPPNHGFVFSTGQLGIGKDGVIPDSVHAVRDHAIFPDPQLPCGKHK
ncbi:MAG: hypothetical protein AAFR45_07785, partial [Pseudomonadota bacterium]